MTPAIAQALARALADPTDATVRALGELLREDHLLRQLAEASRAHYARWGYFRPEAQRVRQRYDQPVILARHPEAI